MKPLPPQKVRDAGGFDLVAVSPDLRLAGRALIAAADLIEVQAQLAIVAPSPATQPKGL